MDGPVAGSEERPARRAARAGYEPAGRDETRRANRAWWDGESRTYLAEHGDFLGADRLVWCPEGLDEDDAGLLGDVDGLQVVEVGCGAGQGTRWATQRGARAVGVDLSAGMLARSRGLDARTGTTAPVLQADAGALPLPDGWADVALTAYGALPFVADAGAVLAEVARVLCPGGRFVAATTHPVRWAFPDDPGPGGLTADRSYFDRTPYTEHAADGTLLYAEHHRTLGDWVRLVHTAGMVLEDLVEPPWPEQNRSVWGGWSPLRGALLPGTAVLVCSR